MSTTNFNLMIKSMSASVSFSKELDLSLLSSCSLTGDVSIYYESFYLFDWLDYVDESLNYRCSRDRKVSNSVANIVSFF